MDNAIQIMDNAIQIFNNPEFGQVRTIIDGDKILFCANDVAKALGYKVPKDAVKQHCRGAVKHLLTDSLGRKQETNFIPEGDIYRLIIRSKLPSAEKFERWVFDEVLPSIRKTGAYALNNKEEMEKYIARRIGIEMRKGMTEAIKEAVPESTHKKFAYPNYTNLVYKTVFSMNTKQLKQDRELEKDANIREHLSAEELMKVKMIEDLVKNYLYAGLEYEQIKNVLRATFPDGVKLIYQVANNKRIA